MTDNACDTRIGVQFILLAVFVMSMQAIAMKAVSSDMSIWQLTVLRSLIVIPVLVVLGIRLAPFNWYRMRSLHWVALRSACMVTMNFTYYSSLPLLHVATAAAAYYTSPIITLLMAVAIVKERVNLLGILAVFLGFAGALLVIDIHGAHGADVNPLVIFPIISAFAYSAASIITRTKCSADNPFLLSLGVHCAFLVTGLLFSLFFGPATSHLPAVKAYFFVSAPWVPIDGKITLWLVGLALFNLTTHLSFVKAYQKGDASKIAIWEYSYLPTVPVMAFVIFDEIPEMAVIIGIGLIIAAGMLSLKSQLLQRALGRVLHR